VSAELENTSELKLGEDFATIPEAAEFQRLQAEQLKLALAGHKQDVTSFRRALEQTTAQIETLDRLKQEMAESQRQQAGDLARLKASYEKGLASVARISEEQRNLAFATERLLQTEAQLLLARRSEEEQRRLLQKLESDRRLKLMQDLEEAKSRLFELQSRIRAADEKLIHMAPARSTFATRHKRPHFQLVRRNGNAWDIVGVDEDLILTPGDVVQVEFKSDVAQD
jgi:polysaccharide export outer membrane protein